MSDGGQVTVTSLNPLSLGRLLNPNTLHSPIIALHPAEVRFLRTVFRGKVGLLTQKCGKLAVKTLGRHPEEALRLPPDDTWRSLRAIEGSDSWNSRRMRAPVVQTLHCVQDDVPIAPDIETVQVIRSQGGKNGE